MNWKDELSFSFHLALDENARPTVSEYLKYPLSVYFARKLAMDTLLEQKYRDACRGRRFEMKVRVVRKPWGSGRQFLRVSKDDVITLVVVGVHPSDTGSH